MILHFAMDLSRSCLDDCYFKNISCKEAKRINSNADSASPGKGKITINCLV